VNGKARKTSVGDRGSVGRETIKVMVIKHKEVIRAKPALPGECPYGGGAVACRQTKGGKRGRKCAVERSLGSHQKIGE